MSLIKSLLQDMFNFISRSSIRELEGQLNRRADGYEAAVDKRIEDRLCNTEFNIDERLAKLEKRIEERIDERLAKLEKRTEERIDERLAKLETRTDGRMEHHERKVDSMIRQMSNDIVERNDLMLQIFDQSLDKQRREIDALRESTSRPTASVSNSDKSSDSARNEKEKSTNNGSASQKQLVSFRKLANVTTNIKTKIDHSGKTALYHQILDWKKIAQEGLNNFSPAEQEIVDYILSFIDDPQELHYVNQHMRRFISTLHRIPPAQRSTDHLLELGSLSHLAPAISKFCGYREIQCADFWDSSETVDHQTIKQKEGADTYTFELRNFNVERDLFPYPDGHFRIALCCELIEHLQCDPMHMLWECNRVLEDNGHLVLTTPNIASARAIEGLLVGCAPYLMAQYNVSHTSDQHNREYSPYEVGVALAAAGFTVLELETEDVWSRSNPAILDLLKQVELSTELRGDNIFAIARKTSAPIERYPKELYIN